MSVPTHRGPAVSPLVDLIQTWGLTAILLPISLYVVGTYLSGTYTFFDAGSLIVHEAGHVFFSPFGKTIHLLGGSLFQLLLPALVVVAFARVIYVPGIQVGLVWLGQNALNVATYVGDAQERALPLITRDASTHDWWQLLRAADLLAYDDVFADILFASALGILLLALVLPRLVW